MQTEYPAVRRVMGPRRDELDDARIEDLLVELFPGAEPWEVEDFMSTVQRFGKQAAPMAQQALPGMIQGAKQGAMVGGPWGAVIGAAGGGAASLMSKGQPAAGAPPQAPPSAPVEPSAQREVAAQLLALLSRPETLQALLAMLMTHAGRSTVAVGTHQVPTHAFANAVSELAARVGDTAPPSEDPSPSKYLFESSGAPRCDIVNPADRARLLLSDLIEVSAREAAELDSVEEEPLATLKDEAWRDPIDSYEEALDGRNNYDD